MDILPFWYRLGYLAILLCKYSFSDLVLALFLPGRVCFRSEAKPWYLLKRLIYLLCMTSVPSGAAVNLLCQAM